MRSERCCHFVGFHHVAASFKAHAGPGIVSPTIITHLHPAKYAFCWFWAPRGEIVSVQRVKNKVFIAG